MCVIRFYLLNNMAESAVVLAHTFPSHPLSNSVLRTLTVSPTSASPHLPPSWLAGFTLLTLGSVLRYASYCYLGTLYTFRLSIRDAHHLVTSGPYAHVRHPGYLGAILTLAGVGTCTFGPGSLLHDGGWLATRAGAALGATLVLGMGMMVRMVVARVPVEDAVLRREFGQEWERWARRVPYALIPGIY
ncbi:hypothetical protein DENSPDRAFT_823691 [Dentipellis sp. KUC8613]|nr:hypothetical protein DENSPDRAFT_823691 [Dentipellis sp. KUC8613]